MKETTAKILFVLVLIALAASACGPKSSATQVPVTAPAATEPEPTPTLAPIDLGGGLLMQVGATYSYVDGSTLVAVPGGEFTMGYGNEDNLEHKVTLNDFWIYRDEVTNGQYALCVSLGKCSPPTASLDIYYGQDLHRNEPVTGVKWDQAQAYCEFVNGRLPSEAEWEKTARGPAGNVYPWGEAAANCELANASKCKSETTTVGFYPKGVSYYGATDMLGNVFEWVADWFDPQYYQVSPAESPLGPETGTLRSVRSSAHHTAFYLAEVARRYNEDPTKPRDDLGFRCVVEDPTQFAPWCQMVAVVGPDLSGNGPTVSQIPVPDCPDISVTTAGFCNKNFNPPQPSASLNFSVDPLPAGAVVNYPAGCVPDGATADPTDYYCAGAGSEGSASIQASCTVPPPPAPAGCAPGYTQNGNICEYTGGALAGIPGAQCLPGINYDPATQCCGVIPGATDSYALCPVGTYYVFNGGVGVCMPWPLQTTVTDSASVGLGSCDKPGENGCNLNQVACGNYKFDPTLCCCLSPTGGGCVPPPAP